MADYKAARENMIESQIRPNGITESRVIAAFAAVPREVFVSEGRASVAYMDEDVPLDDEPVAHLALDERSLHRAQRSATRRSAW